MNASGFVQTVIGSVTQAIGYRSKARSTPIQSQIDEIINYCAVKCR